MASFDLTNLILWLNTAGTIWWDSVRQSVPLTLACIALVWLVCRTGARRLSPPVQSWLWWLACLKIVLCFACVPLIPIAILPQQTPTAIVHLPGLGEDAVGALPAFGEESAAVQPVANVPASTLRLSPAGGIFAVWLTGIGVALVRVLLQAHALRRICRNARDASDSEEAVQMRKLGVRMGLVTPPRLAVSTEVSAPLVCGGLRPVVLLPSRDNVSVDETGMILAHELAHLRRGDLWLAWVPWAARAVTFWLPWVSLPIVRGWERAREAACDFAAVRVTGTNPDRYCRLLLDIVGTDRQARHGWTGALGATEAFHTLHGRIESLKGLAGRPQTLTLTGFVSLSLLLPVLFLHPVTSTTATVIRSLSTPRPLPSVADVPTVPAWDVHIGDDAKKRYILTGVALGQPAPGEGYGLLIVLPGGDGSSNFSPFMRRLAQRALGREWVVAQLVAPVWDKQQPHEVVWPTRTNPWPGMGFATEDFVRDTIGDVQARLAINPRRVLILGWASGGPAATAATLAPDVPSRGGFLAMSQWHDWEVPAEGAKDRRCFILHPEEVTFVPIRDARSAVTRLKASGVEAELVSYRGGYGWHGDVYAQIRQGMAYLDKPQ